MEDRTLTDIESDIKSCKEKMQKYAVLYHKDKERLKTLISEITKKHETLFNIKEGDQIHISRNVYCGVYYFYECVITIGKVTPKFINGHVDKDHILRKDGKGGVYSNIIADGVSFRVSKKNFFTMVKKCNKSLLRDYSISQILDE
jgi:hypothetical protein